MTELARMKSREFNAFESAKADLPFQTGISIPIFSCFMLSAIHKEFVFAS